MWLRAMKKQSQNKPNFLNAQMNVSSVLTKYYENVPLRRRGQNKPNFRKAKMKLNFYSTKDYENEPRLRTSLRMIL